MLGHLRIISAAGYSPLLPTHHARVSIFGTRDPNATPSIRNYASPESSRSYPIVDQPAPNKIQFPSLTWGWFDPFNAFSLQRYGLLLRASVSPFRILRCNVPGRIAPFSSRLRIPVRAVFLMGSNLSSRLVVRGLLIN